MRIRVPVLKNQKYKSDFQTKINNNEIQKRVKGNNKKEKTIRWEMKLIKSTINTILESQNIQNIQIIHVIVDSFYLLRIEKWNLFKSQKRLTEKISRFVHKIICVFMH